jgi:hypothetical protein
MDTPVKADGSLLRVIECALRKETPVPRKPPFHFNMTPKALEHNTKILEECGYDLEKVIQQNTGSTTSHGYEFRDKEMLWAILGNHPYYNDFKSFLSQGVDLDFTEEITEEVRVEELEANLERGNHKSAQGQEETLSKLLAKDVKHGFAVPLYKGGVQSIPGAMVQPCRITSQFMLEPDGSRAVKKRLTHDMSFGMTHDKVSVNERIDMTAYEEMVYGWCLPRLIHFIVALRLKHPRKRILIAKYDFSDAYRRMTFSARAANQMILVVGETAYLFLRLTFGGSPNPPAWCAFSEMVTDLFNDLAEEDDWDPRVVKSPLTQMRGPKIHSRLSDLGQAKEMSVVVATGREAVSDCFIDDIVGVMLHQEGDQGRYARDTEAVPLAIHATMRPHGGDGSEPVPRRPLLSDTKLEAVGTPAERQIILGWEIDTGELTIRLPWDKYVAWVEDIVNALRKGNVSKHELESIVGRLNHASFIIPLARHFLRHLRQQIPHGRKLSTRVDLNREPVDELELWFKLLLQARNGISLNQMTIRKPSQLLFSNPCPFGLGGMTWQGRAWRLKIPKSSILFGIMRPTTSWSTLPW